MRSLARGNPAVSYVKKIMSNTALIEVCACVLSTGPRSSPQLVQTFCPQLATSGLDKKLDQSFCPALKSGLGEQKGVGWFRFGLDLFVPQGYIAFFSHNHVGAAPSCTLFRGPSPPRAMHLRPGTRGNGRGRAFPLAWPMDTEPPRAFPLAWPMDTELPPSPLPLRPWWFRGT